MPVESINEIVARTYSNYVIACPLNENWEEINGAVIKLTESDIRVYYSADEMASDDPTDKLNITVEDINPITP